MLRKISLAIISGFLITSTLSGQSLDTLISKIFFNTDLAKADTGIPSVFKTKIELKYVDNGWIALPPIYGDNDTPKAYSFEFEKNSFFANSFDSGSVMAIVVKSRNKELLDYVSLAIFCSDIPSADSTFKELNLQFAKSLKKTEEKELGDTFKEMFYFDEIHKRKIALIRDRGMIHPSNHKTLIWLQIWYLNS